MHVFELILTKNIITSEEWRKLSLVIAKHVKGVKPFTILVHFNENLVRYFLISKHDLSTLSSGIEGIVLAKVGQKDKNITDTPDSCSRIMFVKVPVGGNLLDLKERYKVQESLDLNKVFIDVQRFGGDRIIAKIHYYFKFGSAWKASHQQLTIFPSHLLATDFDKNTNYLEKSAPKYLNIEKTLHMLQSDGTNAVFSISAFPYSSQTYYLGINNYEFDKHSFIIGASGSGKSKLINILIDRLARTDLTKRLRIVVIDPHASIADDLIHIPNNRIINFSGEAAQLFPDAATDISAATELTTTLFKSLIAEQYNPKLERVLRFSLFVLLVSQSMSLQMLKTFLTDIDVRNQILEHVQGYVPENILQFFGSDFNEIRAQHYNDGILPIISLVDEMQMQPTLVGETDMSLAKTIQENFLTVFSLNKVSMGDKVVKTVSGLLIQQIFLLAQARIFNQKVILIIDEVSVIQNPALASILAEARKFNLTVILTQQYFGQIDKDLRDAILSNVFNYYVFKVSGEDARALEGNLEINIPSEILVEQKEKGIKESEVRAKIMVELSPRECLVRVSANGQLLPSLIAKTVDAPVYEPSSTSLQDQELEPYKKTKLPPKFKEDKSRFIDDNRIYDLDNKTNPKHDHSKSLMTELGSLANDSAEVKVTKNYGWSLGDILKKQSSSRALANKKEVNK